MNTHSSTLSKLAKSAAIVLLATIFGNSVGLLAEVIIARSLPPSLYGELTLTYTIVFSLGTIALLGIHQGMTRQISAVETKKCQVQIFYAGFSMVLLSAVAAVGGLYISRGWLANVMSANYLHHHLLLLSPFLFVYPLSRAALATLRAQKRTLPAVIAQQIGGRGIAFVSLLLFILAGREFDGAIVYWVTAPLFALVIALYFISTSELPRNLFNILPDQETARKLWGFSWPLAIGSGIFLLLNRVDILMIGYFLPSDEVGYYRAVQPLKKIATFALGSFTFLFLPVATEYYTEGDTAGLDQIFTITTKWILLITLPPVLLFALFSGEVIQILFGESYLPAAPVLTILSTGLLFRALSGLDGDMVKAIDRPRIELFSGGLGLVSNIVLNYLLIPVFEISGAAIATVVGYIIYNGVELIWIYRLTGGSPFSVNIAKYIGAMSALAILVSRIIPSPIGLIGLGCVGISLILLQPVVLILTSSVDEADIDLIEQVETRMGRDLEIVKRMARKGL
ncbi:flippase [Haloarcula sp. CBA1122]|uniref:flippase n=1 Tax=Haloarcula sp. CBA1122 TaxID=2668069 RepID=UPI00130C7FA9|nr:oligosaccharide flippase family protein [Haloarcula sp. CBA1122]